MTYYLGRAGALVALPDPEAGLSQEPDRIGGTHQLLSGNRVRDTLGRMRSWNLSWTALDLATLGTLQSFYQGTVGPGPYYFLDPEQRNLLIANVSSGTDVTADATGFGTFGALTIASSTSTALGGSRALFVQWTGVVTARGAGADANTPQAVVIAGQSYAGQFAVKLGGGTSSFQVECRLVWYDATATYISEVAGAAVTPTTGGWLVASCTGTAPAGAVYCNVRVTNTIATTTTTSVFADQWQLEQAAAASAWTPGLGVPLVTVEALPRTTPLAGICDAQMTLVQVG